MDTQDKPRLVRKKTLILNTSKEMLAKYGKQVSMATIAKELNMDPSNLYYYFKSIPEILDTILNNEYHDFNLNNLRYKELDNNPVPVLKDMVSMIAEFYYDNLSILQIILAQVSPLSIDKDYKEDSVAINHFLETYHEANKSLEKAIEQGKKLGKISEKYTTSTILNTIRGYIFGLYAAWRDEKPPRDHIPGIIEKFISIYEIK